MQRLTCNRLAVALQPTLAWAEDRALLRSNPSAVPGAKTGVGIGSSGPLPLPPITLRDWHQAQNLDGTMPSSLRRMRRVSLTLNC